MKCKKCGQQFDGSQGDICPGCGDHVGDRERTGPPWERRRELGFWRAMGETLKGVLLDPSRTFADMKIGGGLGEPMLYAVILGAIGGIFGLVWQGMFSWLGLLMGAEPLGETMFSGIVLAVIAVALPAFVIVGLFITSGILHLCLMIVGGAAQGFEATFRVVSYASGSTAPLQIVPFCGGLLAFVWTIACEIIGLRQAHEISTGKAAVAVFLPLLICCGGAIFLFLAVGSALITALRGSL